MTKVGKQVP